MKKETYVYPSTGARMKAEYKIFIVAFVFIVIADSIGQIQVPLGPGTLILFPIFYSLIMGVLAGPALIFQEIGNLGTIFLALPFALLLGLKREAIGATHSINRESNLALITDMFGPDSPETRGSLSIYVVGGMVGTIYFGFMTTMVASLGIFHPYALGMASGVGAGILMASATASLALVYPEMASELSALASTSETISGITGIYVAIFVGIPLTKKLYQILEPPIARLRREPSEVLESRKLEENTEEK